MNALMDRQARRQRGEPAPEIVRPPKGGRDRRTVTAVASLVVVAASVAAFASLYSSAGRKTAVIVVQQALVQGQPITSAQLAEADVSVPAGVDVIPVADAHSLVGKRAALAVPVGSLLTTSDLRAAPTVSATGSVVGLALKDGQFPGSGLVPGEQVMIVQTATPGSPLSAPVSGSATSESGSTSGSGSTALYGSGTGVLVARATVFAVSAPSANSSGGFAELVSVEVPSVVAPDVATASSADQVSLVLLSPAAQDGGAPA